MQLMNKSKIVTLILLNLVTIYWVRAQSGYLQTGIYHVADSSNGVRCKYVLIRDTAFLYLLSEPILTTKNIKSLKIEHSGLIDNWELVIGLNKRGKRIWRSATAGSVGKRIAFVLDNSVLVAPNITEPVTTGQIGIAGNYTHEQLETFKITLKKEHHKIVRPHP
jgi:preprotein translocase subunit SecD